MGAAKGYEYVVRGSEEEKSAKTSSFTVISQ